MLFYLIVAFVALLTSVAGLLVSLWGIVVTSRTTGVIHIEGILQPIFLGTFVLFAMKIYLIWKGYSHYKANNLPKAKLYFGMVAVLFLGMLAVGLMAYLGLFW
jgi:hypothetical protein